MNGKLSNDDVMYLLAALAGFDLQTTPASEARARMRTLGLFAADGSLTAIGKGLAERAVQMVKAELSRLV